MEYWHYLWKKESKKQRKVRLTIIMGGYMRYHNADIRPEMKLPVFMLENQPLCSTCIVKPTDRLIPND